MFKKMLAFSIAVLSICALSGCSSDESSNESQTAESVTTADNDNAVSDNSSQSGTVSVGDDNNNNNNDSSAPVDEDEPAEGSVEETSSNSEKHSVTNSYDIADYPAYSEYLKSDYANDKSEYSYALYDINDDGAPELITYFDAGKQSIHEIRDIDMNSYVRSNLSASSYLCEGNTVLFTQGDPPYVQCTFLNPLISGMNDRTECLTLRGELVVESGKISVKEYEGNESEFYHYVLDKNERCGSDSFAQYDLGIQTPSEDMKISFDEADQVLSKYCPITIETDKVSNIL